MEWNINGTEFHYIISFCSASFRLFSLLTDTHGGITWKMAEMVEINYFLQLFTIIINNNNHVAAYVCDVCVIVWSWKTQHIHSLSIHSERKKIEFLYH